MRQTRRYKIEGKVQDVYFRDFTQEQADMLNIVGWVRNCSDGTVESIATALPADLDIFVEKLSQGPELGTKSFLSSAWTEPHKSLLNKG